MTAGLTPEQIVRDLVSSIWEGHDIGRIYDCYLHNCRLYSPLRTCLYGREYLVEKLTELIFFCSDYEFTIEQSYVFDQTVYIRYVIDSKAERGKLSGSSLYYLDRQRIVEQYDSPSIDAIIAWAAGDETIARRQVDQSLFWFPALVRGETERSVGQTAIQPVAESEGYHPSTHNSSSILHTIWNRKDLSILTCGYAPDARIRCSRGAEPVDLKQYERWIWELLVAFPDLRVWVDDTLTDGKGSLSIIRWTFQGTHQNSTRTYGDPTYRLVTVSCLNESIYSAGVIDQEYTALDHEALLVMLEAFREADSSQTTTLEHIPHHSKVEEDT